MSSLEVSIIVLHGRKEENQNQESFGSLFFVAAPFSFFSSVEGSQRKIAKDRKATTPFPLRCQEFFFELQFTFREMFWLHYGTAWDIMEEHNFKMKGEKLWD